MGTRCVPGSTLSPPRHPNPVSPRWSQGYCVSRMKKAGLREFKGCPMPPASTRQNLLPEAGLSDPRALAVPVHACGPAVPGLTSACVWRPPRRSPVSIWYRSQCKSLLLGLLCLTLLPPQFCFPPCSCDPEVSGLPSTSVCGLGWSENEPEPQSDRKEP